MSLELVGILRQVIEFLDSSQVPIVTHRNSEEEYVGNEIWRRSWSSMDM